MRTLLLIIFATSFISLKAQPFSPYGGIGYSQSGVFNRYNQLSDTNSLNKKWSLNKYAGISTGFGFFNGGSSTMISAPVGLQLNRRLTKNLYAFAGVSVAPVYFSLNNSFANQGLYKNNSGIQGFSANKFGVYSRAEAGLMYINDERTFSISGSFGIDRSSYPIYPPGLVTPQRQQPFVGTR